MNSPAQGLTCSRARSVAAEKKDLPQVPMVEKDLPQVLRALRRKHPVHLVRRRRTFLVAASLTRKDEYVSR